MTSPSSLGVHTGYKLRMVSNAVSQNFARSLEDEGVTVAEWAFLRTLYDVDAIAPSVLSEKMGMTKGAISKLSDRLLGKQLIERTDNADDRRAHSLSLSLAGRDKVPVLAAIADKNDVEYFGVLTPDECETLRQILNSLAERRGLFNIPVD